MDPVHVWRWVRHQRPPDPQSGGRCAPSVTVVAMAQTKHPAQADRWIEYVSLDQLKVHPDNPRTHDEAELRASMLRFGFTTPPMVDGRTGLIAEGHGRRKVAMQLRQEGAPPPPGVQVTEAGDWRVPVYRGWSSRNDDELRAYLLAGNLGGGYDDQQLADLLTELAKDDHGLIGTGFDLDDLDKLVAELGAGELPDQGTDADHAEDTNRGEADTPRTVQGIHEVALGFQEANHRDFVSAVAQLRSRWQVDGTPMIVLRALKETVARP